MTMNLLSRNKRVRTSGSTTVEFVLVGIPLMFTLITTFEMARGMWMYETVAHAVREGARYAAVHGSDCSASPNSCSINLGTTNGTQLGIAKVIQNAAIGVDATLFTVTISTESPSSSTAVNTSNATVLSPTLLASATSFSTWSGSVPGNDVVVGGVYTFRTALVMFWPGARGGFGIPTITIGAQSRERIGF
jgi:Flp pilus assembly protein TadG